jgi:hypothetical protein
MQNIQTQLREQLASIEWNLLMPHAQRDALIIVSEQLDLLEVGVAVAEDNSSSVSTWINQHLIYKPSSQDLSTWNNQPKKQFMTLIVQPFVLVQEKKL